MDRSLGKVLEELTARQQETAITQRIDWVMELDVSMFDLFIVVVLLIIVNFLHPMHRQQVTRFCSTVYEEHTKNCLGCRNRQPYDTIMTI